MGDLFLPRETYYKKFYVGGDSDNPLIGLVVGYSNVKNTLVNTPPTTGPFTYKIRLCSGNKQDQPDDQVISVPATSDLTNTSGGRNNFRVGNGLISRGDFVRVIQNKRTLGWEIVARSKLCADTRLSDSAREGICEARTSWSFDRETGLFQVPLNQQGPNGGLPINENGGHEHPNPSKATGALLKLEPARLPSSCQPSSMSGMGSQMSGLLNSVRDMRTGLLGDDSFLMTSQDFINDAQDQINSVSNMMTQAMSFLINEIKRQILRTVNKVVNNTVGAAYLNTRYQIFEGVDKGTLALCCAFSAILDTLAAYIADALTQFLNDVINPAVCAIENFLSNLISQIANGILNAISGILAGIGNIIGAAIGAIDSVLSVVESLLNLFEGCPPEQICPVDENWNFLDGVGGVGGSPINFGDVMNRVNASVSAFGGLSDSVTDFADSIGNFEFNLDVGAGVAAASGCFVGPVPCGPPVVRFFGGGAISDATGLPIVSPSGEILGITITGSGFEYTSPPTVVIDDPCGLGIGARATATIGIVTVTGAPSGGGYRPTSVPPATPTPTAATTPTATSTGAATTPTGAATTPTVAAGTPARAGSAGALRAGGAGGIPVTVGGRGGTPVTCGGLPVTAGAVGGLPLVAGGTRVTGSNVTVGGVGGTQLRAGATGGTPVVAGTLSVIAGGSGGDPVVVDASSASAPISSVVASSSVIACVFPSAAGYRGPGIYLNLTTVPSTVNVTFVVTRGGANSYSVTIPDVTTFDAATDPTGLSYSLTGGRLYGPISNTRGRLYVGNTVVSGIVGSGSRPDTTIVIEEDGDDWDDFVISTNRGNFVDLVDCTPSASTIGVTGVTMLSTGYGYLPYPDGSRGAVGRLYGDRCQTLIQRASGTWDEPYNPGEVIEIDTGDRVALPGMGEVELGDATLPSALSRIGARILRVNPPLVTSPYRSMIGFDDGSGTLSSSIRSMIGFSDAAGAAGGFGLEDVISARNQGYSDADIRYYLENDYTGTIGPRMRALLANPDWGRAPSATASASTSGANWFSMEDYNEARRQGFTDADIRNYLEKNYLGRISPRIQAFLNDPEWGRLATQPRGYYGIRQMFDFDDAPGYRGTFGYNIDYFEAKRRGFSDADIRYYLENHYTGTIGIRMQEALSDPNFGRIQGITNMAGVVYNEFGRPRDMVGFSVSGNFGNSDYQRARAAGYTDHDVRYFLENVFTGTIGARIRVLLSNPSWGALPTQRGFVDVPGSEPFGSEGAVFGQEDYEQARRVEISDQQYIYEAGGPLTVPWDQSLYAQAAQMGYTDADVRYYLENYYEGEIHATMQRRLDDPNWGTSLPVIPRPERAPSTRIRNMVGVFSDRAGRRDEFSTADVDAARALGFRDVDIRYYLENNYEGYIAESVRRLLNDPGWGRLGQTITVSFTAPGCPDDTPVADFAAGERTVVGRLGGAVILDPGFRYDCSRDTITVTPDLGARLEYECVNGSLSRIRVVDPGSGFTELPEIRINSDTGHNARILPVLEFVEPTLDDGGGTPIKVIDCVGTIPPRRELDIVPD